jgi:predicted  nucleic acid-binding Zn-ribbon protein
VRDVFYLNLSLLFTLGLISWMDRRLLRQNQDEKIGLESELGKLSRKVHELQSQLTDVHHAKRRGESEIDDENENKNDNDPLDVSVVVAASGEYACNHVVCGL